MGNNIEEQRVKGVLLIATVGAAFAFCTLLFGYLLADDTNSVLLEDRWLNLQLVATLPTFLVSPLASCRYRLRLTKKQFARTHLVLLAVLGVYFTVQYGLLRREQGQVLATFQTFRRAYSAGDEQRAYTLMTPEWQQGYGVGDVFRETTDFWALGPAHSIYTVRLYGYSGRAEVVPDARTSWWFRPSAGASWGFEKVDDVWYLAPANINFYTAF